MHVATRFMLPTLLAAAIAFGLSAHAADNGAGAPGDKQLNQLYCCLLYTSPSPRDRQKSRMPSSA